MDLLLTKNYSNNMNYLIKETILENYIKNVILFKLNSIPDFLIKTIFDYSLILYKNDYDFSIIYNIEENDVMYIKSIYLIEHLNYNMLDPDEHSVHVMELPDYIPTFPCSWKNDEEQRKFILDYR